MPKATFKKTTKSDKTGNLAEHTSISKFKKKLAYKNLLEIKC